VSSFFTLLIKRLILSNTNIITRYLVFRCGYPDCRKEIPVKLRMKKQEGELSYENAILDSECPFCYQFNHSFSKDNIREVSEVEFGAIAINLLRKTGKKPVNLDWGFGNEV